MVTGSHPDALRKRAKSWTFSGFNPVTCADTIWSLLRRTATSPGVTARAYSGATFLFGPVHSKDAP